MEKRTKSKHSYVRIRDKAQVRAKQENGCSQRKFCTFAWE